MSESSEKTARRLLGHIETLQSSEKALRASSTTADLQKHVRTILESVLETRKVTLEEALDDESQWARDQNRTLVLPVEPAGCRVIFPLDTGAFRVETRLPVELVTVLSREILDRMVAVVETTLHSIRERERLAGSRLLLDSILDSIPLTIISANESRKIVAANANAEVLFGVRRIDFLEEKLEDGIPGEAGKQLKVMFDTVRRENRMFEKEIQHTAGGIALDLGVTASPLGNPGQDIGGVVFVVRDLFISREMQKLRELDRLKTEFVHTVSHELKTPLTAVIGSLGLLKMSMDGFDEQNRELIDLIDRGVKQLQGLVLDILSMSQLERGAVKLQIQPVGVYELLHMVTDRMPEKRRSRIKIDGPSREYTVSVDPVKMAQVLENLITNALKYSPEREQVEILVRYRRGVLRVEVNDRGIGIKPKDRTNIFKQFFRTEEARVGGQEGTGLGLAITRELVQLHGGNLTFKSRKGGGTSFTLELQSAKGGSRV